MAGEGFVTLVKTRVTQNRSVTAVHAEPNRRRGRLELLDVTMPSTANVASGPLLSMIAWGRVENARCAQRAMATACGQTNLLEDLKAIEDLEQIRQLFADLETKKEVIELLSWAEDGGVRIFIGSENKLFSLSGSSIIAAPFRDRESHIVGVLGVIGPTRLNYARIVPMVDFTSKVVARVLQSG